MHLPSAFVISYIVSRRKESEHSMMDHNMNMTPRCNVPERDDCSEWVVGMAYVPWQTFGQVYDPKRALMAGTIFPELDKPFTGKCRGGRGK